MPKVTLIVEIDLDKPLRNAEDERYLCASIEEGIAYGWYDYMMNEDAMPAAPKSHPICRLRHGRREVVADVAA